MLALQLLQWVDEDIGESKDSIAENPLTWRLIG